MGEDRAKTLPAFHAFTGADTTGRLFGIGKLTSLQAYMNATLNIISFLQMLLTLTEVTEHMLSSLDTFVCSVYSTKGMFVNDNHPRI